MGIIKMKFSIVALVATVAARHHHHEYVALDARPPTVGLASGYIPHTKEDYDNGKTLWAANYKKYRAARPNAQQCSQSWECRGARLCERGGWCSGYDGCEGTPL